MASLATFTIQRLLHNVDAIDPKIVEMMVDARVFKPLARFFTLSQYLMRKEWV